MGEFTRRNRPFSRFPVVCSLQQRNLRHVYSGLRYDRSWRCLCLDECVTLIEPLSEAERLPGYIIYRWFACLLLFRRSLAQAPNLTSGTFLD
jgi:hypothetical protein